MESRVGVSLQASITSAVPMDPFGSGPSRPNPHMGSGELSINSFYGIPPGIGGKDLGCFFLGGWD